MGGRWSRRQCGELMVYTEKDLAMPASAGMGTNQEAMEEELQPAACVQSEWHTSSSKDTDGKLGQVSGEAVMHAVFDCSSLASTPLLADEPTATCQGSNSQPMLFIP